MWGWSGPARSVGLPPGPDTLRAVEGSLSVLATLLRFPSRNQLSKMFPSDIFAARLMTSSAPFTYHKAEKADTLQLLQSLVSHLHLQSHKVCSKIKRMLNKYSVEVQMAT